MRICYLGESTSIHDLRFIRKLVEKGYDTHVVTFAPEPVKIYGASYHRFPQLEDPQKHSRLMGDLIFLRNLVCYRSFLRRLLKEIKPDILHAGWIPSHGLVAVVSGFHPLLLMPWGSDILILPNNLLSNRMITRYVINKADMITCDAEHVKREIIKLSGYPEDRITIFPWGIDLGKFSPNNGDQEIRRKLGWEDGKVLIMTRNFKPIYGVGYFLQALPHIISRHPQVKVILCGEGPLREEFEKFAQVNGLQDCIYFTGFVENDFLPSYLVAADIYISSSLSDGTSLSLLEAMGCGLPMVVTDLPANREWVIDGENGFIVPCRDPVALAKGVNEILERDDLRKEFGKRNQQIAQERANWDRNFEKLEGMYQKLVKRP